MVATVIEKVAILITLLTLLFNFAINIYALCLMQDLKYWFGSVFRSKLGLVCNGPYWMESKLMLQASSAMCELRREWASFVRKLVEALATSELPSPANSCAPNFVCVLVCAQTSTNRLYHSVRTGFLILGLRTMLEEGTNVMGQCAPKCVVQSCVNVL